MLTSAESHQTTNQLVTCVATKMKQSNTFSLIALLCKIYWKSFFPLTQTGKIHFTKANNNCFRPISTTKKQISEGRKFKSDQIRKVKYTPMTGAFYELLRNVKEMVWLLKKETLKGV